MDAKNVIMLTGEVCSKVSTGETKTEGLYYMFFHLKAHNGKKKEGGYRGMCITCKSFSNSQFDSDLKKGDKVTVQGELRITYKEDIDGNLEMDEVYVKIDDVQKIVEGMAVPQQPLPVSVVDGVVQQTQPVMVPPQMAQPNMVSSMVQPSAMPQAAPPMVQPNMVPPTTMQPQTMVPPQMAQPNMVPPMVQPSAMPQAAPPMVQPNMVPPTTPVVAQEVAKLELTGTDGFRPVQKGDDIPF